MFDCFELKTEAVKQQQLTTVYYEGGDAMTTSETRVTRVAFVQLTSPALKTHDRNPIAREFRMEIEHTYREQILPQRRVFIDKDSP